MLLYMVGQVTGERRRKKKMGLTYLNSNEKSEWKSVGHETYDYAPWQASVGGLVLLADEVHDVGGESIRKKMSNERDSLRKGRA
jgi:hypothetical protein